jgi:hypothetical protein
VRERQRDRGRERDREREKKRERETHPHVTSAREDDGHDDKAEDVGVVSHLRATRAVTEDSLLEVWKESIGDDTHRDED